LTIRITGIDDALALLNPARLNHVVQMASLAVAAEAQDRIAPYPAQSHRKQPFTSDKQRRGFFARLRSGEIVVPYRRGGPGSEALGRSWSIRPYGDMGAVLENSASYADLVHGADTQTAYMRGSGWKTDEGVVTAIEQDGTVERIAEQVIAREYGF
jgi:hypothetical protein